MINNRLFLSFIITIKEINKNKKEINKNMKLIKINITKINIIYIYVYL